MSVIFKIPKRSTNLGLGRFSISEHEQSKLMNLKANEFTEKKDNDLGLFHGYFFVYSSVCLNLVLV